MFKRGIAGLVASVFVGIVAGGVIFVAIGLLQLVATGLNIGVLYDIQTELQGVIGPSSAHWVMAIMFTLAILGTVFLSDLKSPAFGLAAASAVIMFVVLGTFWFYPAYLGDPGASDWFTDVVVAGAQSLASPIVAGVLLATSIGAMKTKQHSTTVVSSAEIDA